MNFPRRLLAGLLLAGALLVGACGTNVNNHPVSSGTSATGAVPTAAPATTPTTVKAVAHVGSTLAVADAEGHHFEATLLAVANPATPGQYESVDPGTKLVGVEVRYDNTSSGTISGDANNDVTVLGSNNQAADWSPDDITNGSNFNSGSYLLGPGQSITGWVSFEMPIAVNPVQVTLSPGMEGGTAGQWVVP